MAQIPYMNPLAPNPNFGLPMPGTAAIGGTGVLDQKGHTGLTPREGQIATTKSLVRSRPDVIADPFLYQRQAQQMLHADPRYAYWQNQMADQGQAYDQANAAMGREMSSSTGPGAAWQARAGRAVDAAGRAQQQQAMGNIAKQGAMQSRGGMSPAAVRQSMMMQSQVGANMASQIAAQRQQAQQEAQRAYLAARQQNLQNMQSGFGMKQAGAQQQLQEFGGLSQIGSGAWANQLNATGDLEF